MERSKKDFLNKLVSFIEANSSLIIAALVIFVIFAGMAYSFYLKDSIRYGDERDYYVLAKNIVAKHSYTVDGVSPTAFRAPGYPFFLSLFVFLGWGMPYIRILNFIALGISIYLVYLIIKRLSSKFATIIGALLVICYPVLFYAAGTFYAQTIGALIFLSILFLLLKEQAGSVKSFLIIGAFLGFLILTIPTFIFCLPIFVLWIIFSMQRNRIRASVALILMTMLIVSIWSFRNYSVYHSFVFISSNSGRNLFQGNWVNTNPNDLTEVNEAVDSYIKNKPDLNDVQFDAYMRSEAIKFILTHKSYIFRLYFMKFLNYFNYHNELVIRSEMSKTRDILMLLTWGPILLVFLIRLFYIGRFRPSNFEILLIVLYFASAFFYAIFYTRIRFRLPFDFLPIIVVALFIDNVIKKLITDSRR